MSKAINMIERVKEPGSNARFAICLATVLLTQVRHAFVEPTTFGKDTIFLMASV